MLLGGTAILRYVKQSRPNDRIQGREMRAVAQAKLAKPDDTTGGVRVP
jgi:hypothetical protein